MKLTELERKNLHKLNECAIALHEVERWGKRGKAAFDGLVEKGLAILATDPEDEDLCAYEITPAGEEALA